MSDEKRHTDTERAAESSPPPSALSEKQRRELWVYMAVSIVAVELLVAVGAILYGFIRIEPGAPEGFVFPWMSWGAVAVMAPTLILLLAHAADVGLFRAPRGGAQAERDWQRLLPERLQKLYRLFRGAPIVVVLVGIVVLGAALLTLDGAFSAIGRFGSSLLPYLPWIIGGVCGVAGVVVIAVVWLHFRTRRLIAEYEFRREVLEKTGIVIVDKGSTALPPGGGATDVPYALVAGGDAPDGSARAALPAGRAAPEETDGGADKE